MSRSKALAAHLGCDLDEVTRAEWGENTFEAEGEEWLVLKDDEADAEAWDRIAESAWAFNASFLAHHMVGGLTKEDVDGIRGDRCEDASPAIRALIRDLGAFVEDAVSCDGRGHFLAGYDGEEHESQGYYLYRTN